MPHLHNRAGTFASTFIIHFLLIGLDLVMLSLVSHIIFKINNMDSYYITRLQKYITSIHAISTFTISKKKTMFILLLYSLLLLHVWVNYYNFCRSVNRYVTQHEKTGLMYTQHICSFSSKPCIFLIV